MSLISVFVSEGNARIWIFKLLDDRDQVLRRLPRNFFPLASTYTVTVYDRYADLVISLCVAIDYVEM